MTTRLRVLSMAALLGAAVHSIMAGAAPCAGFTDVDTASGFCPNVEWLKNRAITLGCSGALYCPNDTVTRLSMAAFLNRLGNALTPVDIQVSDFNSNVDIDTQPTVCRTTPYTVTGAPRLAHGQVAFLVWNGASPADVIVQIVESTDNGVTFAAVAQSQYQAITTSGPTSNHEIVTVMLGPRNLVVGEDYAWGVRLNRYPGSTTTGDVGVWQCHLRVTLENRNALSSPLDPEE